MEKFLIKFHDVRGPAVTRNTDVEGSKMEKFLIKFHDIRGPAVTRNTDVEGKVE